MRNATRAIVLTACLGATCGAVASAAQDDAAVVRQKLQALEASQAQLLIELRAVEKQLAEIRSLLQAQSPAPVARPQAPTSPISLVGAATRGSPTAKIVLIEYSDFQCPFCGVFSSTTLPRVEKDYVSTGKVLLAFRHFPLESIHPAALKAAESAECAARQGKFWEMHDALFLEQRTLDEPSLLRRAQRIGLDSTRFAECLKGQATEKVRQDMAGALALQMTGTPTFLIGTRQPDGTVKATQMVVGNQPFETLKAYIDGLLAAALRN